MKKTKILVPAMALLALSTAASVTGTVAWFSMNDKVSVTGMNVHTNVGSNLLISATNSESAFASGLDQPVTGLLEPVSTVDGVDFYYHATSNVYGDGSVDDDTFVPYVEGDAFDINYGVDSTPSSADAFGYKDYSFYIKATNGNSATRTLAMTRCNITYKGSALSSNDKAWRVALFGVSTAKATTVADDAAAVVGNLKSMLKLSTAAYFDDVAVDDESTLAAPNAALGAYAEVGDVASSQTGYFKIVVRLWLEGNDTSCNNDTYAQLSGDFRLDLSFTMVDTSEARGVQVLGSVGNAVATADGKVGTITLTNTTTGNIANGETAASFQWYNEATDTEISGATTYQYSNTANTAINAYCMVTTNRGNIYRSNTVELAANA